MNRSIQLRLLPYALVIFLGFVGFALPLPLLPEMFLGESGGFFSEGTTAATKMLLLGFVMSGYPFGQFLGSPILGHFSDRFGRKNLILLSLSGTLLGYVITALFVSLHSVVGLFLSLAFCGFCEGNVTIAQAVIADLTHAEGKPEKKAFYFGWLNIFISLGFIVGPLMGGQLASRSLVSWFSYSTPFWMAALLTGLGMVVILLFAKETQRVKEEASWSFMQSVLAGFQKRSLRTYYLANFFLALGSFFYFRFLPVFFDRVFDFSAKDLGYLMTYNSVTMAVGALFLIPKLSARYKPLGQMRFFAFLLSGAFVLCVLPSYALAFLWTVPIVGILLIVAITNGSLLISNEASPSFQGRALGTLTSVQVLAACVTGVSGGIMAAEMVALPLYVGAVMVALCGCVLIRRQT